jgi:integrase
VDRATGTVNRKDAAKILAAVKEEIKRGAFATPQDATFASAALSYLRRGGDKTFLKPLVDHFGNKPLKLITQEDVDAAAVALYPRNTAASHNRQVYTPVSAVMKDAGFPFLHRLDGGQVKMRRPAGAQGKPRERWLKPPEAFAILAAAQSRALRLRTDAALRFAVLLPFLLYTGLRISEALRVRPEDLELDRGYCFVGHTKNGQPRAVHLPEHVVNALRALPVSHGLVFGRMARASDLYAAFREVCKAASVHVPPRLGFHIFRHSYASWMRRYAGLDTSGLVATGAWKSRESASVYEHADASEEAKKADLLPFRGRNEGADSASA